jgi:hypothetical protein
MELLARLVVGPTFHDGIGSAEEATQAYNLWLTTILDAVRQLLEFEVDSPG